MERTLNSPDVPGILEKWLEITVDRLHEALDDHDIGQLDGELWKSIVGEIITSGKDVESVIVEFLQHGRFVDMGVGRGMPLGSRRTLGDDAFFKKRNGRGRLHRYHRTPKPWYSKVKTRELARIREILATENAQFILAEVENAIRIGTVSDFPA